VLIPGQRFSVEERPEAVVVLVIDTEQRAKYRETLSYGSTT
jgi:hypothetical protein